MTGPTHRDGPMAFVPDLDHPVLGDDDRHHLARVLRVRDGDPMVVCDGEGRWRRSRFGDDAAIEEALGDVEAVPAPAPLLQVGFALIKGDRPELVVQKLTELGVDRIVPFTSDHGVVRWDPKRAQRQHERFERIAREASMQCRRTHLPVVAPVTSFAELAAAAPRPLLADIDGAALASAAVAPDAGTVTVLIGPEGGWSAAERSAGLAAVRIGDHVLRAETASIAAATLLAALRANR